MKLEHVLVLSLFVGALGHGALTKPLPRLVSGQQYCPWCVGEHQPVTNPSGVVNRDAEPSSPCLGSQIGDAPYPASNYNNYRVATAPAEPSYTAGGKLEANIVLDADHNGDAIFDYCPHSEAQTEECFRSRPINDWTDVHAYWDASNTDDHWKSGQWFPQTVDLPADMPSGPVTVRWLWVCKYTDEIFVSCVDLDIVGGVATTTRLAGTTTTTTASSECIWTEPAGRTVERVSREEKDGRICWDVTVPSGTKVYYQSKTDIYHTWNSNACCLSAAESFGSDVTGNPNLVVFTPTANVGTFGFCECTAWDPSNPGTCAGAATSDNMICPVLGASKDMCSEAASWDGLPVGCTPVFSTTPSATATTTQAASTTSPTDGCCYWDANKGCEGSGYCWESKANCEGTCNGKWLANTPTTMAPTTVVTTTTVATTTAPVYTTTTTVTTTTTTTPMPTTTTMPSTTPASSDSFEPVDGGVGRACRGAHAGDNDPSHFTTVSGGVDSLDECKAHCLSTVGCHGIENIGRRCEIWTHPVEASISLDGYVCLRLQGGPVTTTPPPTRPVQSSCGQLHDRCGGDMYTGSSCCVSGLRCEYKDSKYSQCVMDASSTQTCAQIWQQCGGAGWTGSECCVEGLTCVWGNEHYSQCLRLPGSLIEGAVEKVPVEKRSRLRKSRRPAALESRPWLVQRRTVTAKVKESEL